MGMFHSSDLLLQHIIAALHLLAVITVICDATIALNKHNNLQTNLMIDGGSIAFICFLIYPLHLLQSRVIESTYADQALIDHDFFLTTTLEISLLAISIIIMLTITWFKTQIPPRNHPHNDLTNNYFFKA